MSDEFNLRAVVRAVRQDRPDLTNPRTIAAEVAARVVAENHAAALGQALPSYIAEYLSTERAQHPVSLPGAARGRPTGPAATSFSNAGTRAPGSPVPSAPVARPLSAKVSAVRDGWQQALGVLIHVGPGQRLPLGDCERMHLDFAAAELDEQADRCASKARAYREFGRLLDDYEVRRIRDLPAEVLLATLGAAA